ncbi:hypothetical protein NG895_02360 [Aeoliella sp. ICT_H6.2]|uniref:Uncharacterized protein n=1 Tax=Aeoliella straminimaris TaxID=2954799 RepID=A0A9X2F5R9_9BACT|nr:hypothetical protein [Aeoliella straminimaris]MCO6042740.1 hypothetical protein [Aeoliella straminimaris]
MSRSYPNSKDCEFLLYLIYNEARGMALREFSGTCEHYNRWTPTEATLLAAMARLIEHGFVYENDGTLFAHPNIIESFHRGRRPGGDQFDDMDTLQALVKSCGNA